MEKELLLLEILKGLIYGKLKQGAQITLPNGEVIKVKKLRNGSLIRKNYLPIRIFLYTFYLYSLTPI